MRKALLAAALALGMAGAAAADSITTLFAGGNSGSAGGAVYFDLNVINPNGIRITGLDTNSLQTGTPFSIQFFTIPGGRAGNMGSPNGWTDQGTGSGTTAGPNNPSFADLPDFVLGPGLYGVALVMDAATQHAYTNGDGNNQNFSNGDVALELGNADNVPFSGGAFSPRVWNGTLYYDIVPAPAALALLGIAGAVTRRRRRA